MAESKTFTSFLSGSNVRSTSFEVSEIVSVPQVTRDGHLVRTVNLNDDRVAELVDRLKVPPRSSLPRVVTQSVAAGTLVQRGTAIDLTLVRPVDIKFDVFGKVHSALLNRSVASMLAAMPANVTSIVAAKEGPATLTAAERDTVTTFLNSQQIATAGGVNENSFEAVYGVLVDSQVFK
jgi:hypothetical protein